MNRVDRLLVELGLAPSRTHAQYLIEVGRVSVEIDGQHRVLTKPGQRFADDFTAFCIAPDLADRFVSRGGLKMAGALSATGLSVAGMSVLDIGQSTGGFTDCVLQQGAAYVVGVDVGHGQLAARLRDDHRVRYFEGVNARALNHQRLLAANQDQPFDLIVCDVSFISLTLVLPSALLLLREGGYLLSLVKPQFEVGREGIGRGGIVRDAQLYEGVRRKISEAVVSAGLQVCQWLDSPITGGDGNREFFIFACKGS